MSQKQNPNKYAKNANIEAESTLGTIKSIVAMALMVLGIVGLAMELFKGGGIFGTVVSKLFESTTSMMLIPIIAAAFWFFNKLTSSPSASETRKAGDIPMYIMMAIGAFFLFRLITTGGF